MGLALLKIEGKQCNRCGVIKPDTLEYYRLYNKSGIQAWQKKRKAICRVCERVAARKWALTHPEEMLAHQQGRYAKNPQKSREQNRYYKFGLTPARFNELLEEQGYACAICKDKKQLLGPVGGAESFHVDHCHKTKKIRGLLCSKCNQAIGLLRESIEIVSALKIYLERNKHE